MRGMQREGSASNEPCTVASLSWNNSLRRNEGLETWPTNSSRTAYDRGEEIELGATAI